MQNHPMLFKLSFGWNETERSSKKVQYDFLLAIKSLLVDG